MDRGVIETGDKVICLYRKGNNQEGRIHFDIGTVIFMNTNDEYSHFYSVKLDKSDEMISILNVKPYGAVVPYSKELEEKMVILHRKRLRLVLAIEDDYFENLEGKQ